MELTNLDQFSPHYYLLYGCHADRRINMLITIYFEIVLYVLGRKT